MPLIRPKKRLFQIGFKQIKKNCAKRGYDTLKVLKTSKKVYEVIYSESLLNTSYIEIKQMLIQNKCYKNAPLLV